MEHGRHSEHPGSLQIHWLVDTFVCSVHYIAVRLLAKYVIAQFGSTSGDCELIWRSANFDLVCCHSKLACELRVLDMWPPP